MGMPQIFPVFSKQNIQNHPDFFQIAQTCLTTSFQNSQFPSQLLVSNIVYPPVVNRSWLEKTYK